MVAVRCDKCQKVELYSQEDYELKKRDDDLRCTHTELCREEDPKGTVMKEISVYDFKCDKCSTVLARSVADESGYLCVSAAPMGRSIMCNTGDKGDRKLYCRKICAMSNCDKLGYGDCPAVEAYRKNKNIGDAALAMMCNSCPNRRSCPEKCRPYVRENAISACSKCSHSLCVPKPHVIDFDERWEAKCPVCGGKTRSCQSASVCHECAGRGYKGRVGLFELYSPALGIDTSMADDAREKIASGVTSELEVARVMGED
jgi:hypothetical protein